MSQLSAKPRLAFLGAGPDEVEVLLEVHAAGLATILGVYDIDATSPGLALAEVVGIPSGCDMAALERLRDAEAVVLPRDRYKVQDAVRWAGGLRAELVPLPEARRRWGGVVAPAAPASPDPVLATQALQDAVDVSSRLQDRAALADWLLGTTLRAVGGNGGSIQLLAAETGELFLVAARGLSERLVRFGRHRVGEGVSGVVAATLAPQLVHGPKPGRVARERGEITSSISMPLDDGGELVGVLNVSTTVQGKRFDTEHLRRLEHLAPRLARLLREATHLERSLPGLELPRLLQRFEAEALDLQGRLAELCERARATLAADGAALYLATEDGDWLCAHATTGPAPGATFSVASRAPLDTARLESRWVHATTSPGTAQPADPLTAAVDRALESGPPAHSQVFAPLSGIEPVGVLVLEFAALEAADRCMRDGAFVVEQIGLCCDTLVREHRQGVRLERFAALARTIHRLQELVGSEAFEATLAEEAARLVGARAASVRQVDEMQRTYSRPVPFNVDPATLEAWRALDVRISERTLQVRRGILTTAADAARSGPGDGTPHCSLLSVPFFHAGTIVALINLYGKTPQDFLENDAFTRFDLELLDCLALVLAWPFAPGQPEFSVAGEPAGAAHSTAPSRAGSAAAPAPPAPAAPTSATMPMPPPTRAPAPSEIAPGASDAHTFAASRRGTAPVATEPAPHRVLQDMLHVAARDQRSLGVWLLRFDGVSRLGDEAEPARRTLAASVQRGLRAGDAVAWVGEQDLAVFGLEPPPASVGFEARLAALVRPQLARMGRPLETGIELRIGASAFPQDGPDASRLLAAAAERAR